MIELPNGRLVCDHGLVTCGYCCVDYSFMDELSSDEEAEEEEEEDLRECSSDDHGSLRDETRQPQRSARTGDGLVEEMSQLGVRIVQGDGFRDFRMVDDKKPGEIIATVYDTHIAADELDNSEARVVPIYRLDSSPRVLRYALREDIDQLVVYADGACLDNGKPTARAGFGFCFAPQYRNRQGGMSSRLELRGPDGKLYAQTSNRAELRAAIAVLEYRAWSGEGFKGIIIAMDSEYVVQGATLWIKKWLLSNWTTSNGKPVQNRDLWEKLLKLVAKRHNQGLKVRFWRIPRTENSSADKLAKEGAAFDSVEDFCIIAGFEWPLTD